VWLQGFGRDLAEPRIIAQSVELRITLDLKVPMPALYGALQAIKGLLPTITFAEPLRTLRN
jgi:hypothetical protein